MRSYNLSPLLLNSFFSGCDSHHYSRFHQKDRKIRKKKNDKVLFLSLYHILDYLSAPVQLRL